VADLAVKLDAEIASKAELKEETSEMIREEVRGLRKRNVNA